MTTPLPAWRPTDGPARVTAPTLPGEITDRDGRNFAAKQSAADRRRAADASEFAAMMARHPQLGELLAERYATSTSEFVLDMRAALRAGRPLTGAQLAAAVRTVDRDRRKESLRAAGVRVPTGRIAVTGRVVRAETRHTRFGRGREEIRITVETGDGWRVMGTAPAGLFPDRHPGVPLVEWIRGRAVTFAATVEPSGRDPLFGFFKRPAGGQVLPAVEANACSGSASEPAGFVSGWAALAAQPDQKGK